MEFSQAKVTVLNMAILSPGRPDKVLPIPFAQDDKGLSYVLKEATRCSFRFSFTVSNGPVSGLRYINTVRRAGSKVDNQEVMLGNFRPRQEPYTYTTDEEETPAGLLMRSGAFDGLMRFVDDHGRDYLNMTYRFKIVMEWPASA